MSSCALCFLEPPYNSHTCDYIALQQWTCGEPPSDDADAALSRQRTTDRTSVSGPSWHGFRS